jgi:hypothetical protein
MIAEEYAPDDRMNIKICSPTILIDLLVELGRIRNIALVRV